MNATIKSPDSLATPFYERYLSLDVLRGLIIALMIIVTSAGSRKDVYPILVHAEWDGFTLADLVFPAFLFIIGNAMSFSMKKLIAQQNSGTFLKKVFKRTIIIFILGLLLHSFPFVVRTGNGFELFDFSSIRIMGVLARIAVCYCITSLLIYYFKTKGAIIYSVVVLIAYWGILYCFGDHPHPYELSNNAVLKVDLFFFSPNNLYHNFGIPFDPEGLLSTFPAVVNVIAGYLAGLYIQKSHRNLRTVLMLLLVAIACIAVALLWDIYFPINKKLWTSSFVLFTSGWCLAILALLMYTIEIVKFNKWTYFFEAFGKNPLFIFILAGLIKKLMNLIRFNNLSVKDFLYGHLFLPWSEGPIASLLYAIFFTILMWLIAYWMDRKKLYIKV